MREQLAVREVAALAVLDGDRQTLRRLAAAGERRVVALEDERHVAADEGEGRVRPERPGKEPRLAENLKTVADPEHEPALRGKPGDGVHHRRKARDRAAA